MKIYSYRVEHDFGLAPNPFGEYCTLTVCKTKIRKSNNLNIGDWIIGTGSKALEKSSGFKCTSKLIYAMKITEILNINSYWSNPRFAYKRPNMEGTLSTRFGDNFYYLDEDAKWKQIDCAHRNLDGIYNKEHIRKDIGGKNALISKTFYYFGDNAPEIPENMIKICHVTTGEKIVRPNELASEFIHWLQINFSVGMHGLPISWAMYNK